MHTRESAADRVPHQQTDALEAQADGDLGLERIVFFSDAVIAIAITLLALEIRLPEVSGAEIPSALLSLWPRYLGFVVSFLVVGSFWFGHHRMFRVIRRYDDTLVWLNILFLLCVAFIPFASSVLGEHGDEHPAAIFYALVMIVTGGVEALLWMYAVRGHRLVEASLPARSIRLASLRVLTPPGVFLVSLPIAAFVHPYVAMLTWLAIYPIVAALVRAELSRAAPRGRAD